MIRYQKDKEQIVVLTLDMEGRSHNILNHEIAGAFEPVIEHLKGEKAKGELKGVIITSAKKSFLAGGDLEYLYRIEDPAQVFRFTEKLKKIFRDLERPGIPVVAALNGTALGTGFELALACHHRVLLERPHIRVGLPEVRFGLMPGNGGVIRLMWLLGIERAFHILVEGRRFTPREALSAGIVDELAADEKELLLKARQWLLSHPEGRRPWDRKDGRIPGGTAKGRLGLELIPRLNAQLTSSFHGNYPAPEAILDTLCEASKVDFDTASKIESRRYAALLCHPKTKNMIKAFWFDHNAIREGLSRPKGFGRFRPRKVGIIGAGRMGSSIALCCLLNGLEVVLKDISKMVAERGREHIVQGLKKQVEAGRISPEEMERLLEKVLTTDTPNDFASCDVVIEAVFENENVKKKVHRETEPFLDEFSFFASNTVSIPITRLAGASSRPGQFIGLHFFPPAEVVPLVEVVRGAKTEEETVAKAFDFALCIRKTPIIVKDDWGFYASRVRNTYILEGITLLQEGVPPEAIENLGLQAGMPEGPLALADELSLPLVWKYEKQAAAHYGEKYVQHPAIEVVERMIEEYQREGRKGGAGFYEYEGPAPVLWTELTQFARSRTAPPAAEIKERFLFAQVVEAGWCLHERVIRSVPEANLGSILGWGFPPFTGGVIQYVVHYGKEAFLKRCRQLEKVHGSRFKAPAWLKSLKVNELEPSL